MTIKVLGVGCKKCSDLMKNAQTAVAEMGVDVAIEKVEDFQEIMAYGVMNTPALVVDGEVKSTGKVLSVKDIKKYL